MKEDLHKHNLELIRQANETYFKYKRPLYLLSPGQTEAAPSGGEVTPLLPNVNLVIPSSSLSNPQKIHTVQQSSLLKVEKCSPNVATETISNVTLNENNNSEAEGGPVSDLASANCETRINADRLSNLEKRFQEVGLRLQNLYDNLEAVELNSNMYFSKVIEYLDD